MSLGWQPFFFKASKSSHRAEVGIPSCKNVVFVHHPQFGPACIHSPQDLAFAFKHLFLSVWPNTEQIKLINPIQETSCKFIFSQRPPDTRAARAPPRSASRRVSGRCRRTSAFRRVSGRRRRASASRLVSGGVGGPRPLRGSGGSSASGRRLGPPVPQEAAPPRPRREALSPGLPGFSLPPETHSSAPRQPRLKRRGRRQEEGRWGRVQTKELGRSALSAWGTALNHRGRRPPGWKAQPQSVSGPWDPEPDLSVG